MRQIGHRVAPVLVVGVSALLALPGADAAPALRPLRTVGRFCEGFFWQSASSDMAPTGRSLGRAVPALLASKRICRQTQHSKPQRTWSGRQQA